MVDKLPRSFDYLVAPCVFCLLRSSASKVWAKSILLHMIHSGEDFTTVVGKADPLCYRGYAGA